MRIAVALITFHLTAFGSANPTLPGPFENANRPRSENPLNTKIVDCLHDKKTDAETAGYVARMKIQYDHTDEKGLISEALDHVMNARRFANALDIGPGPGEVTQPLSERSDKLTLIELNEEYRAPLAAKFPRAEIIIDSIHNRSYSQTFDAILFSHGFYYLDDVEWLPFARHLISYLKPGGSLFIVMNNDEGDGARIIRSFWDKHPKMKSHSFPPWNEFKRELATLGTLRSHSITYHWHFRQEETVKVLGSSILAIEHESHLQEVTPDLNRYASTLARDGENFVMNVGADVVEIRNTNASPGT